ncbi:cytochrome P450 [Sphingomonas sp. 22R3R2A-7]|uniref:cytochrome P450 n=1 Tax=Sphingomonas sp. 22R3R2A-7 TaxID=3050230 RepID=UPI002FE16EBA
MTQHPHKTASSSLPDLEAFGNAGADARSAAYAMPLSAIDMSNTDLYLNDTQAPYFTRLRDEAPVHYCPNGRFGAFWSITRYADIRAVEANPTVFSSDALFGGITIRDQPPGFTTPMFIAMDPPGHAVQRAAVAPMFARKNLDLLEGRLRDCVTRILDDLPVGETFDWVDRVSREVAIQMLAIMLDIPFADRAKLSAWSDMAVAVDEQAGGPSPAERQAVLLQCLGYFTDLWKARIALPPRHDLISMLAHNPATQGMSPMTYLGNLMLLIVGGNDTTRNSITGGLLFLNDNPAQYRKLRHDPGLIGTMVPEIIRYQTPLAHMRRTARSDIVFGGEQIRKGDRVILWYVSGNRDERAIEQPDSFLIDRVKPNQHLAYGSGIHVCMGSRLAEMQLRILWEEILARWPLIEVVGAPTRVPSSFIRGYQSLPVRIPTRS